MAKNSSYTRDKQEVKAITDQLLEGLLSLETFDKGRQAAVIDRVLVYNEERIEIVWKMDDLFFPETVGEKELISLQ